ncbi:MAG: hypothetical protein E7255_14375 [Lachnospiraceae bacterium]|nr:hypothetical protein [Lachnospiraceae bacterium]
MLDEKDLQLIAGLINTSAKETITVLADEMDKRITQTENSVIARAEELIDSRITQTENLSLDETEPEAYWKMKLKQ